MTSKPFKTPPRARQLGATLRAVRKNRTDLSAEQAAKQLQWSPAKMSRFENGRCHITSDDVAVVTATYRLPLSERDDLIRYAQHGDPAVWWDPPMPDVVHEMSAITSYLDNADTITDWATTLVPSLLQIEGYAKAFLRSIGKTPDETHAHWQARRHHQQNLGTADYTAFICENVLHRPFGGPEVHREQLHHLAEARERGIGVRIVPRHSPVGALLHSWQHMTFPNATPVVNVESFEGRFYFHADKADVFGEQIAPLDTLAYPSEVSNALLRRLIAGTRKPTLESRADYRLPTTSNV